VGVLVVFVVEGRVLVAQERGLLEEVGHGLPVALGADLESRVVGRPGRVRPGPLLPVGLGGVYGAQ
jgi:hypothetical protein